MMNNNLLAELPEEELAAPEYYPIEYALMWVAYGNKPINQDYAKIIYDPPPKYMTTPLLKSAEAKLFTYLRSGKIAAKTMGYKKNKEGKYIRTGKYESLDRETWKGRFDWDDLNLNCPDAKGVWYEYTDIVVNTKELLKCQPISLKIDEKNSDKSPAILIEKPLHLKEKETLLKMVIGMAMDGYGYDPLASKSPIPAQLSNILAEQGMALDVDTVRKWLKQGAELVPQIQKQKTAK